MCHAIGNVQHHVCRRQRGVSHARSCVGIHCVSQSCCCPHQHAHAAVGRVPPGWTIQWKTASYWVGSVLTAKCTETPHFNTLDASCQLLPHEMWYAANWHNNFSVNILQCGYSKNHTHTLSNWNNLRQSNSAIKAILTECSTVSEVILEVGSRGQCTLSWQQSTQDNQASAYEKCC